MKKRIKNKYLALLSFVILLASCEQDSVGPESKSVSSGFDVSKVTLSSSTTNLNEKIGQFPVITADWEETASYELFLRGLSSGAEKVFYGTSTKLEQEWNGLSSNMQFFRTGEYVSIHLKLAGANEIVSSDTLFVKGAYNFDGKIDKNGVKYFVVENFETDEDQFQPDFPLGQVSPDAKDENVLFQNTSDLSVEGKSSMLIAGSDVNGNGWSGDYYHQYLGAFLASKGKGFPIDSGIDPEDLYFNIFIYGTGAEGTTVQIAVSEIDGGDTLTDQNEINDWIVSGFENKSDYIAADNDSWIYSIPVKWVGWKQVSIPYSEFWLKAVSTGGDKIKESFRISGITLSLLSFPTAGFDTKAYIDYLTITTGGKAQYNLK